MIEAVRLSKSFGDVKALNKITLEIADGQIFGLLGTNGAGKSTFLRLAAGILKQDEGTVCADGRPVYDNQLVKQEIFFIPNDYYFLPNSTPEDMCRYIADIYPRFDTYKSRQLLKFFNLNSDRKIAGFSKGMKKQLSLILGLSSGTRYLLCDETFDGLDPVARQAVKSLFAREMVDRDLTPVISSHNLREIEDICDHIGLLHEGGVLLSQDIEKMKLGLQKVQCVFASAEDHVKAFSGMDVMVSESRGKLDTMTIRGTREDTEKYFRGIHTVFFEILPLTLEEIFISETEAVGYDVRKFIIE